MKKRVTILALGLMILGSTSSLSFAEGVSNLATHFIVKNSYEVSTFVDITGTEWYANDVKACFEKGLMSGKGVGSFDAKGNLTVATS